MRTPACVLLTLSLFAWASLGNQQDAPAVPAVVYVYSYKHVKTLGRVAPEIFVDGKVVAKLDGERFFVLRLEPGTHTLHVKDKKRGGIETDFVTGQTYYVRMNKREGTTVGPSGLEFVSEENARFDLKQMKPVKLDDIKDKERVSVE